MITNDGTQERALQPPDDALSDAEIRECQRAAHIGFDAMDERAKEWLDGQLADTPADIADMVRKMFLTALTSNTAENEELTAQAMLAIRTRYSNECAEDYWGDLMEQAKHAQEDR